jgi:hypothetical protein
MFILGIKRLNIQWIIGFKHLRLDKGRYIFRPLSADQLPLKRQFGSIGRNIYRNLTDGRNICGLICDLRDFMRRWPQVSCGGAESPDIRVTAVTFMAYERHLESGR